VTGFDVCHSRVVGESVSALNGSSEAVLSSLAPIRVSVRIPPKQIKLGPLPGYGVPAVPRWAEKHCTRGARAIARQRKVKLPETYEWELERMPEGEGRLWLTWFPEAR
jgi:hypothetical protein